MKPDQISELMKSERPQDWIEACQLAVDSHQWARLIHLTCSTFYHAFTYEPKIPDAPKLEDHVFCFTGLNRFICSMEPAERAAFRKEIRRHLMNPIYDRSTKMMVAGSTGWALGAVDQLFQMTYSLAVPLIDKELTERIELATRVEQIRTQSFMGSSILIGRIRAWISIKYQTLYPPGALSEGKAWVESAFTLKGMGQVKTD